ncbi:MAG: hypothetical protein SGPRY_005440 [Prymnesium sp.]
MVVVGDDDVFYAPSFLNDFSRALQAQPQGTVLSAGRDMSCTSLNPCVMGFKGVGLRAGMLADLHAHPSPPDCFLADDVFITFFFRKVKRFSIERVHLSARNSLDRQVAWSNSSVNAAHARVNFMANAACLRALGLDARAEPSCGSAACGRRKNG